MTDITNIKQYLEWKAEREGRMIDTSPEAWLYQCAVEQLAKAAEKIISEDAGSIYDLGDSLTAYEDAKEALNAH